MLLQRLKDTLKEAKHRVLRPNRPNLPTCVHVVEHHPQPHRVL